MAGLLGLSIDPKTYEDNFLEDLFWETFYRQHLGEQYGGLSTHKEGQKIKIQTHRGLFRHTFQNNLTGLEGTEGVGYCGHTREPFLIGSKIGEMSICFSGNIINLSELVDEFKSFGHIFERCGDDIEIIAKLIAQICDYVILVNKKTTKYLQKYLKDFYLFSTLNQAQEFVNNLAQSGDAILYENDLPDIYDEKIIF